MEKMYVSGKPETLWGNVPRGSDDPMVVLAQVLRGRGLDIGINPHAYDRNRQPQPTHVAVHGSPEARRVLDELWQTPEMRILNTIGAIGKDWSGTADVEKDIERTQWDDRTRKEVVALYLNTHALHTIRVLVPQVSQARWVRSIAAEEERLTREAKEAQARAKTILGGSFQTLPTFTAVTIRSFVEKVVDGKLPPKQTQQDRSVTPSAPQVSIEQTQQQRTGRLDTLRSKLASFVRKSS